MDSRYMKRALTLARRGLGTTSPNPMVGAVIVDDNGRIVAEGYHRRAGGEHAEAVALRRAGPHARGKTLYVTLEPCNHRGQTPPCTDAIIASGIRRVVAAVADPNPRVAGGGLDRLRSAGIAVELGDGADSARRLNRPFFMWSVANRPWITLKAALSLDGKIADYRGSSQYLTGPEALAVTHQLRREHDVILVGSGTILADNPQLTYRGRGRGHDPVRVILDSTGRVQPQARIFHVASQAPTLVFTGDATPVEWEHELFAVGAEVVRVELDHLGHVALPQVLHELADRRLISVLVEGGSAIHGAFLQADLVDRWVGFMAPLLLGGALAPSAAAGPGRALNEALRLVIEQVRQRGQDVVVDAVRPEMAVPEITLQEVPEDVYRAH